MDKEQKKIINKFCKYVITGKQEFMISTPPDPMYRVLAEEIERLRKENLKQKGIIQALASDLYVAQRIDSLEPKIKWKWKK